MPRVIPHSRFLRIVRAISILDPPHAIVSSGPPAKKECCKPPVYRSEPPLFRPQDIPENCRCSEVVNRRAIIPLAKPANNIVDAPRIRFDIPGPGCPIAKKSCRNGDRSIESWAVVDICVDRLISIANLPPLQFFRHFFAPGISLKYSHCLRSLLQGLKEAHGRSHLPYRYHMW